MASALAQGQKGQTTMALSSETVSQFHNPEVDFLSLFAGLTESQLTLYETFPKDKVVPFFFQELKTTVYRSKTFPFNNIHRIDKMSLYFDSVYLLM